MHSYIVLQICTFGMIYNPRVMVQLTVLWQFNTTTGMYPTGSLFLSLGSEWHISVINRLCIRPRSWRAQTIFYQSLDRYPKLASENRCCITKKYYEGLDGDFSDRYSSIEDRRRCLPRSSVHGRSISEISIQTFVTVTTILTRKLAALVEFHVLNQLHLLNIDSQSPR